jgi:sigma-B regulation protein RsbQ
MNTDVRHRHNVQVSGREGGPTLLFAHGFGCDQQMWRFVAPAFEHSHRVVLFDHIGCGGADASAYDTQRHATLDGYADDVVQILEGLDLRDVVFVGHSVSAQIGLLASIRVPQRFARLVLVGPSPRYLNDPPDYVGGFERADIDGLVDMMERNLLGWANFLAPLVMSGESPEALTDELKASFCAGDPEITRRFAIATFLADNRADLPKVTVPSMIIQCSNDSIAPRSVGDYMAAHLPHSTLRVLQAHGHCPHMTHPQDTIALIREALAA